MSTRSRRRTALNLAVLLLATLAATPAAAQESLTRPSTTHEASSPPSQPSPAPAQTQANTDTKESLRRVLAARRQLEIDLRARQDELRSEASRGREDEIEGEIQILSRELSDLTRSFSELASGVDPISIEPDQTDEEIELTREVRDLLGPLLNELKRATSRPREIDRLRTEITEIEERLDKITDARSRIDRLSRSVQDPELTTALGTETRSWMRRRSALETQLQVAQQKLDLRLGESQTIGQAVENLFQLFFKSRGRNLLLALLATLAFLLGIRRLRTFLSGRPTLSRRSESFEGRVFSLLYSAFSVVGAILVFLVALYFFGDWVLLILMLLLILGLIWTSKQAIPRFWAQAVLILGMGPVREHERVFYQGLPWRIESISFYTILMNPALVGGTIRIPIDDLSDLRSREYDSDEPWFPTHQGDIILMSDGRAAEVELQSVEVVRLRMPGESRTIIPTQDFAGRSIEKLNDGYRIDIQFGLDYGDQAAITTTMRDVLEEGILEKWRGSGWNESFLSAAVEFKEASASSLDYYVRVDFDGTSAFEIQAQARQLARFCVDICNEQGWVIPFTQLTLHVATPGSDTTSN